MPHACDFDEPPFGDCADCGQPFWLAAGERAFFERHSLPWPKRCAGCRERKKQANARRGEGPAFDIRKGGAQDRRDVGRVDSAGRRL